LITEIGIIAGDIWHYLDEHQNCSLDDIIKEIEQRKDITLMSIGWLAREGHIIVEKEGENFKVSLRKKGRK